MKTDMNTITLLIGAYLMKNNIPIEGAKLTIELPGRGHAGELSMCIKRDLDRSQVLDAMRSPILTLNGIGLTVKQAG